MVETHPVIGAAQIVEIRETVREIQIPLHVPGVAAAAPEPKRCPHAPLAFTPHRWRQALLDGLVPLASASAWAASRLARIMAASPEPLGS